MAAERDDNTWNNFPTGMESFGNAVRCEEAHNPVCLRLKLCLADGWPRKRSTRQLLKLGGMHMRSMRSLNTIILVGIWLGGVSACTTVLMNTPVSKRADGWVLTLSQVKQGPNDYEGEGGVLLSAGDNQRLIWTDLTVRNEGGQEQTFSYETCLLVGKDQARQLMVVSRREETNVGVDREEAFEPGQEHMRQLVYSYPKDQRPTALRCGAILLAIPRPK